MRDYPDQSDPPAPNSDERGGFNPLWSCVLLILQIAVERHPSAGIMEVEDLVKMVAPSHLLVMMTVHDVPKENGKGTTLLSRIPCVGCIQGVSILGSKERFKLAYGTSMSSGDAILRQKAAKHWAALMKSEGRYHYEYDEPSSVRVCAEESCERQILDQLDGHPDLENAKILWWSWAWNLRQPAPAGRVKSRSACKRCMLRMKNIIMEDRTITRLVKRRCHIIFVDWTSKIQFESSYEEGKAKAIIDSIEWL